MLYLQKNKLPIILHQVLSVKMHHLCPGIYERGEFTICFLRSSISCDNFLLIMMLLHKQKVGLSYSGFVINRPHPSFF